MVDPIIPSNASSQGLITNNISQVWSDLRASAGSQSMVKYSASKDMPVIPKSAMRKMAQAKADVFRQPANYYHPLYEGINLQLPTKTREINQWVRHFYKCLTPDTEVLMGDGTVKLITDVEVGEYVITHAGIKGRVNEYFEKEISDELYVVKVKGIQEPIKATKQHPFYVHRKEDANCVKGFPTTLCKMGAWGKCKKCKCNKKDLGKPEFVQARDLKVGDYALYPILRTTLIQSEWMNENKARILGYYLAEGSKKGDGNGVRFSLGEHEDGIIKEIGELIHREFGAVGNIYAYGRGCIEYAFFSKELNKFIDECCSGRATTKKVNKYVLYQEPKILKHILGAYLNGDGYLVCGKKQNKGQIVGITASPSLASQLVMMLRKCGVVCKSYRQETTAVTGGSKFASWQVVVPPKYAKMLKDYTKWEVVDKDKYIDHHIIHNGFMLHEIESIERIPEYSGKIYNLNIEGEYNSFVAGGVIVHNTDAMVGTAIDMHSELPLTGFTNVCDDPAIQKFFDIIAFDVLKLPNLLRDISLEYWKIGNVFPFGEWNEDYGIWTRFTCLNPDFVEVEKSVMIDNPIMKLDPDENLKRIVMSHQPKELYEQLLKIEDGEIVRLISRGEKVPLDGNHVSHIAHKLSPYETIGTPLMFRVFKPLIYKDLIRRAQTAIAQSHITPLKLVKVGSDTSPATPEAIVNVRENLEEMGNDLTAWFVYHHSISVDYIASSGHVLPLNTEYDWIEKEMLTGLGINKAMIHGEGPNFATASVGYHVLVSRYLKFQAMLIEWIKNFVYKRIAQEQGFYRVDPISGMKELIIPDVEFELMRLKEDQQLRTLYSGMVKSGLVSKRTFYSTLGINYEKETRQIMKEKLDEKRLKDIDKGKADEKKPEGGEMGMGGDMMVGGGGDMGGGDAPGSLADIMNAPEGGGDEGGAPGGMGKTPPAPEVA